MQELRQAAFRRRALFSGVAFSLIHTLLLSGPGNDCVMHFVLIEFGSYSIHSPPRCSGWQRADVFENDFSPLQNVNVKSMLQNAVIIHRGLHF